MTAFQTVPNCAKQWYKKEEQMLLFFRFDDWGNFCDFICPCTNLSQTSCSKPVSYTHLSAGYRAGFHRDEPCRFPLWQVPIHESELAKVESGKARLYGIQLGTQRLDVYKRQALNSLSEISLCMGRWNHKNSPSHQIEKRGAFAPLFCITA